MNNHRIISRFFPVFLAVVMCITCLCSCTVFNPDRIVEYYFVSCTTPNNVLNLKGYYQFDEALDLAHEIEAIPDPLSTEGVCSFAIRISYIEDGVEKSVKKTGYNTFPENWDRIVELTNIIPNNSNTIPAMARIGIGHHNIPVCGSLPPLFPEDGSFPPPLWAVFVTETVFPSLPINTV